MRYVRDIASNYLLVSAFLSFVCAQISKTFIALRCTRSRKVLRLMFSTGGMPSSHTASVCALCTGSGIQYGLQSFQFAVTLILSLVVMVDASGVRYETGKQAELLNRMTKELFDESDDEFYTNLKELIGHTPLQVFIGALLGVVMAFVMARAYHIL